MKLFTLLSILVFSFGAFAKKKQTLTGSDVKLVNQLDKISELRVYVSKKLKTKYATAQSADTQVNAIISRNSKKESVKKVLKKKVRGKIIGLANTYGDEALKLHVSFDKGCTKVADNCAYQFDLNQGKYYLSGYPKHVTIEDTVIKTSEYTGTKFRNAHLKVIKEDIDEVKNSTIQSTGW